MVVIATASATITANVNAKTLENILPDKLFTEKWVGLMLHLRCLQKSRS